MKTSWEGSNRSERLPSNWKLIRLHVLKRDMYRCQVLVSPNRRCLGTATEVDHIKHGDDHDPSNLQAICHSCHSKKSGQEGYAAMHKKRKDIKQRFRRNEAHPSEL